MLNNVLNKAPSSCFTRQALAARPLTANRRSHRRSNTRCAASTMVQQPHPITIAPSKEPNFVQLADGSKMPMVAYGTFLMQQPGATRQALEVGYRHIDTARLYFNEAMIGQEIKEWIAADPANRKREDLYIVTKVFNDCHRPEDVRKSAEASLKDLDCGYIDCMLIHWPDAFMPGVEIDFMGDSVPRDDKVTLADTWKAMEKLVDDGIAKSIGLSNFSLRQVDEILKVARIQPVHNQVELSPYIPQWTLVEECKKRGVMCTAYCPLGGPSAIKPNKLIQDPVVLKLAQETNKSPAQVLTKWSIQRGVPALPKSSNFDRIKTTYEGIYDWKLTDEQMQALNGLENGYRTCAPGWKTWEDDNSYVKELTAAAA
ncbi:dihydroxyacetone reductase [Dunaliella salina]|uniref:Dihydroxyacetone reductase n=1 Tax=Dunaliella salina TaxID=3046 RepID=A0ABQ7H0S1_DUNSA|nr:dihydroxyacetone reductase [Dunaliella salina]|eukprot:KAF5840439.1 dihydroxyacetone reductase [Dunaliella salina]